MKAYELNKDPSPLSLPAFRGASADELRVLLAVSLSEGGAVFERIVSDTALDPDTVRDALAFWRGAGAVALTDAEQAPKKKHIAAADTLDPYSESETAHIIEKEDLSAFIEQCQETFGKVLSPTDIGIIVGLHEQLCLSCEYICVLIAHCLSHGRKPMRYIEKTAFSLYDSGIETAEQLSAYIKRRERMESREWSVRKLFGIGERAFSKKESEAVTRWCEEYGFDDTVISRAFDAAVASTAKPSIAYADKILSRWYEAGCRNLLAVEELIEKEKAQRATVKKADKKIDPKVAAEKESMRSFDVDDFFEHALSRSYGNRKKKKDTDSQD